MNVSDTELFDRLLSKKTTNGEYARLLGGSFLGSLVETYSIPEGTPKPFFVLRDFKSRNRILKKVQRYIEEEPILGLQGALDKLPDYTGGRLIVYLVDSVNHLYEHVCSFIESSDSWRFDGECSDNISTPRESGWRGLTQKMLVTIEPDTWFPFEVQILTLLQHTWDQLQHRIYEDPDKIPDHLKKFFRDMSDSLHKADTDLNKAHIITGKFMQDDRNQAE